jgi:zinc protease
MRACHFRTLVAARGCIASALGAIALAASAQPFTTPPPPAAPRPLTIATPSEARLANGLRVITARREGVPLVSADLIVLSGSELDPLQLAGLASMSAALLTQGTRLHSAPQIAAAAEALGGSLDSGAGWNQSSVSITVTTPKLDAALGLVREVALEPVFAAEEIDRIRTQTLDELKVAYAEPATLAGLAAQRLAYGAGAYGQSAGGTPQSLPRITRADLVAVHDAAFRPDNAVLILAGDIDPEAGLALARKHFGAWRAPAGALARPQPLAAGASRVAALVIDMPKTGQAGVVIAVALPERPPAERAASQVMNALLGGGYSSRLMQEIRIKRGLSYDASSGIGARGNGAYLRAVVQTKNESAAEVVRVAQAEIDRLMATPADADEIVARKATLIGGFSRSVETTAGLAAAIGALVTTNQPAKDLKMRIDSLQAVTAADVQRYAAAHLGAANRRIVVAGEAAAFGAALQAELPALVTVPLESLDLGRSDGLSRP